MEKPKSKIITDEPKSRQNKRAREKKYLVQNKIGIKSLTVQNLDIISDEPKSRYEYWKYQDQEVATDEQKSL